MLTFNYTALDQANTYTRGSLQAKNKKKAAAQLVASGLLVVNLTQVKNSQFEKFLQLSTVRRIDKIFFTRHLHTLIESGISLDQALKICADQTTNQKLSKVLLDLYEKVKKGQSLHSALSRHKNYFSDFFINLIKVGEASGTLDDVLEHLLEQQEQDYELITKARGAMIYPLVVMTAALLIVILMMSFVIPSITGLLKEYNVDLPLTTRLLIFVSDSLNNFGIYIGIVVLVLVILISRYFKTPSGKAKWDWFKLHAPILNNIVKEFNLARFCRSMSALLKSGVSLDEALAMSATICGNVYYKKAIQSSVNFVRKGIPLTEVLHGNAKLFPPITTRMLEVGEKTGKFDYMFTRLAVFYEKSVLNTINNLSSVIEPIMLLSIGIGVGFIAISILTPIWKFAQTF